MPHENGSSPLTRGKLFHGVRLFRHCRLIPAHAGKTRLTGGHAWYHEAHPRSRGENVMNAFGRESVKGSSPLTRGKPGCGGLDFGGRGLIPAHAGKTLTGRSGTPPAPAHPRSRGENEAARQPHGWETGSSPLTRGKLFLTCAFTAQIDQILETLELAVSSGSYSIWVACATDAPQDQVRSIGLVLPSSRGAS